MSGDDDLLERATRALRAAPPATDEELRIERAVLLRLQHAATQKKSRPRALRWALPLAAALTAGSALAATGQLERAVQSVSTWLSEAPRAPTSQRAKRRPPREQVVRDRRELPERTTTPAIEPSPAPVAMTPDAALAPLSAPNLTVAPEPAPRRPAPKPRPKQQETVEQASGVEQTLAVEQMNADEEPPLPSENPDLVRYREAHELHFRERDFWAALRAWESYLSAYPDGTFAIEARYNRAICLLRLGRKDEARRALAPFADGAVADGYRKTEASELLKALE